jgi:hypothetical protein
MVLKFLQWVIKGALDVYIGANLSVEGGDEEGVDDPAVKVVDIVKTFCLQVAPSFLVSAYSLSSCFHSVITVVATCMTNLLLIRSCLLPL